MTALFFVFQKFTPPRRRSRGNQVIRSPAPLQLDARVIFTNRRGFKTADQQRFFVMSLKFVFLSCFVFCRLHVGLFWVFWQAYSSYTVSALLEQNGACVTADYAAREDGEISVVNTAR